MKHLRKYNESSENEEYDLDFVMAKIKEEFTTEKVKELLNTEGKEWSDDYEENGNGEAEDVIIDQLIEWFESKYKPLGDDSYTEIRDILQQEYEFLNIN